MKCKLNYETWHKVITLLPAKLWDKECRGGVRRVLSSRPCRARRKSYRAGMYYPFRSTIRTVPPSPLYALPASVAPPTSNLDWYFGRRGINNCKFRLRTVISRVCVIKLQKFIYTRTYKPSRWPSSNAWHKLLLCGMVCKISPSEVT